MRNEPWKSGGFFSDGALAQMKELYTPSGFEDKTLPESSDEFPHIITSRTVVSGSLNPGQTKMFDEGSDGSPHIDDAGLRKLAKVGQKVDTENHMVVLVGDSNRTSRFKSRALRRMERNSRVYRDLDALLYDREVLQNVRVAVGKAVVSYRRTQNTKKQQEVSVRRGEFITHLRREFTIFPFDYREITQELLRKENWIDAGRFSHPLFGTPRSKLTKFMEAVMSQIEDKIKEENFGTNESLDEVEKQLTLMRAASEDVASVAQQLTALSAQAAAAFK